MKRYLGPVARNVVDSVCESGLTLDFARSCCRVPGDTLLTRVMYSAQGALVTALQFNLSYESSHVSLSNAEAGSAATLVGCILAPI
jgi:hypothetical protein